jgi:hypothetical protein
MRPTTFVAAMMLALCSARSPLSAQALAHTHGAADSRTPTEGGQSAFAAIAEIVKILEADPATDWSKVNLERLRLHLRDMDLVTLRSVVTMSPVDRGASFVVRGTGETIGAIKRARWRQDHRRRAHPRTGVHRPHGLRRSPPDASPHVGPR